jgi:hypothetical protein
MPQARPRCSSGRNEDFFGFEKRTCSVDLLLLSVDLQVILSEELGLCAGD